MSFAGCDDLVIHSNPLLISESPDRCCDVPTVDSYFYGLKAVIDRLLALILLTVALPVIGSIVLLVRLTSRGAGIYRQARVGKGGRIFTMYKIRTMRCDAERKTGPAWAGVARDPRVTQVGSWLRRLHLDELPQLWNVACGQMSLVGPRPERPEFVAILSEQIPGYLNRLTVAPGITGLAQVNLPPDTDLESVRSKLKLDCEYIQSAGFLLDLRILACTALRMFGLRGGRAVWLLGLERKGHLPVGAPAGDDWDGGPVALLAVLQPLTPTRIDSQEHIQNPTLHRTAREAVGGESVIASDLHQGNTLTLPRSIVTPIASEPDTVPADVTHRHQKAK